MPLTLVKEDGTGLANANAYAHVADADAYHEGHLYATTWTAATTQNKEKALVLATRLIDATVRFNGLRNTSTQALHWPRTGAPNPDTALDFAANALPADLVKAACEMAREVIALDRTAAPDGEGVTQIGVVGTVNITFDKDDRRKILTELARLFLSKLGELIDLTTGPALAVRV
jgi:hypothetical protein